MKIIERNIDDLIPADYNPRKRSEHVLNTVRASLDDYGWLAPVVVNSNPERKDIIVGGHRRLEAARASGLKTVPTIEVNLTKDQEKKANLRLNAQEKFDEKSLSTLVAELHTLDADSAKTLGFSEKEIGDLLYAAKYMQNNASGALAEKFLIPPFSVFDSKQGEWQKRKRMWLELLGDLSETRTGTLAKGERNVMMMYGAGVSQFDPVTSEIIMQWFLPKDGKVILDPMCGDAAKGLPAAILGYEYHGVDIREEQIIANRLITDRQKTEGKAHWYTGDARKIDEVLPKDLEADLIFTCPPYYDLEVYSSGDDDLSAHQTYEEFMEGYEEAFKRSAKFLKPNRFAVLVVGDIRDENGIYRNFIRDNITMFERLGFSLYNEIIYLQALSTAPRRAERNMRKRKTVKVHQNILTFYSGDPELLRNPALLDTHLKVLTFLKGDDTSHIQDEFKNPPDIKRDVFDALGIEDPDAPEDRT